MRSGKNLKRVAAGILVLAVLVYFGFEVYNYFASPLSTSAVSEFTVEDTVSLSGWLIREETVLSENSGLLTLALSEGETVGVGQTIATVYSSADGLALQQQLNELTDKRAQLEYAEDAQLGSGTALRLDSDITEKLIALRGVLGAGGAGADADSLIASLRTMIVRRDYAASGESEDLAAQLADLTEQINALETRLKSGSSPITADRSGTYSGVVDGYESVLTPESMEALTPSSLAAVKPESGVTSSVGKLITSDTWYYAAAVSSETAARLRPGHSVTLRFAKGLTEDMTCRVVSLGTEEDGRRVVIFSCNRYLAAMTSLRQLSADIVFNAWTGLRVPKNALRVNEDGQSGVYCMVGLTARFKPVSILYSGDSFCLVAAADGISSEVLRLRAGDELIVSSGELYDGKVMNS